MSHSWKACAGWLAVAMMLIGAGCGGSDAEAEKDSADSAVGETGQGADSSGAADTLAPDAAGTDATVKDTTAQDAKADAADGDADAADGPATDSAAPDSGCSKGCNDGNPCTEDSCAGSACVHTPNGASCDDGDPCTEADSCSGGKCAGKKQYWIKEFGASGDDAGLAIAVTGTDAVIVGYSGGGSAGGSGGDRYSTFTRLDKLGATKSQESYPLVGNDELTALAANGSGWLAVGTAVQASKTMESRAVLVDENGTLISQIPLGSGELYGVAAAQGGGFLAAGYREDGQGDLKLWLLKLGADGTKQWEQLHGTSGFEVAWGLAALPDGGAVTIGDTAPGGLGPHLSLQRFDAAGQATWQRTYADAGQDNGWAVAALLGATAALDGYAVAGSRKEPGAQVVKPWLMRADAAGKQQWQSFVAGSDAGAARAVVPLPAGEFAVAGSRSVGLKQEFALWIAKGTGATKWSQLAAAGEARAVALQQDALVVVGTSASGAEAGNMKVLRIPLGGPGKCGP